MEVTVLPVKNVTFGNIATVLGSHRKRPKRKTSTLSAVTANKKKRMPTGPNFRLSNSGSALQHLLQLLLQPARSRSWRMPKIMLRPHLLRNHISLCPIFKTPPQQHNLPYIRPLLVMATFILPRPPSAGSTTQITLPFYLQVLLVHHFLRQRA